MASLRGAHTKRKFKYGKELSPRGLECECTQKVERFLKGPGNREGQKGCFAVSSMREFPILPPDAVDIVTRSRNRLKQLIAKKIEAEHPNMDADSLAEISPDFLSGSVWSIT
jgi:hypothetical protein